MINLDSISRIGLGTYRMSVKSLNHFQTLGYAVSKSINLIDTSSNYTNGDSEKLIGKYLKDYPSKRKNIFLITKAGYITDNNLDSFTKKNTSLKIPYVSIKENFKYSVHPDYLKIQIETSLRRLKTNYLDCFLLHNPEHYFKVKNNDEKEIYNTISLAFTYLEELKQQGIIRYYGVSSNTLPTPDKPNSISLEQLLSIAKSVSENNSFKFIQFPFNLAENEASEVKQNGQTLIELAKKEGIITLSNRPLNASYEGKFLRLADFPISISKEELDKKDSVVYPKFINSLSVIIKKIDVEANIFEFTPIKTIRDYRKKFGNEEAVLQFSNQQLMPFLAAVFDNEVPQDIFDSVNALINNSIVYSKIQLNEKLRTYKEELLKKGILSDLSKPLPIAACEIYLNKGIDHVLIGLRKEEYINQVLPLIE